tara:strand:+ start:63898 stop:64119 length:222 start_codon:yes stop_codon:yes gene_type:complete
VSNAIIVDLSISADDYLRYYSGQIKQVQAITIDGRSARFPASVLQKVVDHRGVYGRFRIEFTGEGKFKRIERL